MLEIEAWAQPRFKPMAMFAHMVALSAEACHQAVVLARSRHPLPGVECQRVGVAEWLACFERPLKIDGVVCGFVGEEEQHELTRELQRKVSCWYQRAGCAPNARGSIERERRRVERLMDRLYRQHLRQVQAELVGDNSSLGIQRPLTVELLFFLTVAAPCWLEHQQWPGELLQKARRRDFDSLEKLMRLDATVMQDGAVAQWLFELRLREPGRYRLLLTATDRRSLPTITDVKFLLSGLLQRWSQEFEAVLKGELLFRLMLSFTSPDRLADINRWMKRERKRRARQNHGCSLSIPDIRRLFDAVAVDTGRGPRDPDLPQGDEAFRKRTRRNAKLWPSLWNWDKICAA